LSDFDKLTASKPEIAVFSIKKNDGWVGDQVEFFYPGRRIPDDFGAVSFIDDG